MKDGGASFADVDKEITELSKLKPLLVRDPHAESDPKKKREVLEQFVKTFKAAKPHLDKNRTDLVAASRLLDAVGGASPELAALLTVYLGDYFPERGPAQPDVFATGELGKWR
ncbi:hypothetical protein OV450_5290 [Actinobacteria bacterium OV450]|nr:hypothetical protein OV450_5290 [Actinobacteria bacterium OV450]